MPETMTIDRIEKRCVEKGMRMTDQRRVVARVLSQASDHPDVEELYHRAAAVDPHISLATVYRTVRLFEEAGVVERHDFGDGRRFVMAGDQDGDVPGHAGDPRRARPAGLTLLIPARPARIGSDLQLAAAQRARGLQLLAHPARRFN